MKIQIVFYSMYGHVYRMAEAVAEGARARGRRGGKSLSGPGTHVPGGPGRDRRHKAREAFAHIPLAQVDQLAEADAIIFGTPTRFGNMCAQMRNFLDQTGGLWVKGALIGKVGSVFACTGTQHGGQETTITSFHTTLLHHGMIIVGVPYSEPGLGHQRSHRGLALRRHHPRRPGRLPPASDNELAIARFQGQRGRPEITKRLFPVGVPGNFARGDSM